ncbi:MAG TPA: hypothetical protein VKC66_15735, partial [Xanthobacteraceae bacterium]|nr:hypothetical protein [Xanthobacteraceae bacterium]
EAQPDCAATAAGGPRNRFGTGRQLQYCGWGYTRDKEQVPESYLVAHLLARVIMPLAVRTGRCYLAKRPRSG